MEKYAIVKEGVVVNVIEYDEQPSTPPPGFEDGHIAIKEAFASPGWMYQDGQFVDPNPPQTFDLPAPMSLTDAILANPDELAKLKQALGLA